MKPTARRASVDDLSELVRLYHLLAQEMADLKDMWVMADGLAEPIEESLRGLLQDDDALVVIGELQGNPVGFLQAQIEPLLPQGAHSSLASIRLVFTELPARAVGVGTVMRDFAIEEFAKRGVERFDAHVLPGHRLAKNFFEAGGFAARSIIMHRGPE